MFPEPSTSRHGAGQGLTVGCPSCPSVKANAGSCNCHSQNAGNCEAHSEEFLRQLVDDLSDGVYAVDCNRSIIYWNKAAQRLTGYSADEVVGRNCSDHILVHVDVEGNELCHRACPMKATIQDGAPRQTLAFFKHHDGHRVPVCVKISPLHDAEKARIGAVQMFSNNSDELHYLYRREDRVRQQGTDELSGLLTRRIGEAILEETLHLAKLRNESAALILADIDRFHKLNSDHGHSVGDRVLRMLALTMRNSLRKSDEVIRWAGEEFLAVMPSVGMADAINLAERCRKMIQASDLEEGDKRISATMSFGVAMASRVDSTESWLGRARSCLLLAQQRGYNQVVGDASSPAENKLSEPALELV